MSRQGTKKVAKKVERPGLSTEEVDEIKQAFDLFIDDPNSDTITLNSLKKIARELGENMTAEELKDMLERASSNGTELTFDEFYEIMTKKSFP